MARYVDVVQPCFLVIPLQKYRSCGKRIYVLVVAEGSSLPRYRNVVKDEGTKISRNVDTL
jgi:hypothetical protein